VKNGHKHLKIIETAHNPSTTNLKAAAIWSHTRRWTASVRRTLPQYYHLDQRQRPTLGQGSAAPNTVQCGRTACPVISARAGVVGYCIRVLQCTTNQPTVQLILSRS
jgi:hypothetical protein